MTPERLAEKLREYADRDTGYIYAGDVKVLREAAEALAVLERRLVEKDEALRGVGWHDMDGLCWCDQPTEITNFAHSDKCLLAREALRAEPATVQDPASVPRLGEPDA